RRGVRGSRLDCGGEGDPVALLLDDGLEVSASVVLAAPGMDWRRLEVDGMEELLGHGVYYGAGRSDAADSSGERVVIVGAGNSAGQAVLNFADAGARVTMLVRGDELGRGLSAYLVERIRQHPRIDVLLGTQLHGLEAGGAGLAGVIVGDGVGKVRAEPADALYVCIGGEPHTEWCPREGVLTDAAGYILTGPDLLAAGGRRPEGWPLARDPLPLETSRPGLFAAGDVRHGSTKRVASAVGEGAMAASLIFRRLAELGITVSPR